MQVSCSILLSEVLTEAKIHALTRVPAFPVFRGSLSSSDPDNSRDVKELNSEGLVAKSRDSFHRIEVLTIYFFLKSWLAP